MGILDAITTGLSELLSHKMRSALTMLGVIFGVAAVIAMVSIGEGAKQEALRQIELMGIDVVHVKRALITGELLEKSQERSPFGLTYDDYRSLSKVCGYARRVIPMREVFADVKIGEKPVPVKIVGTTPGYMETTRSKLLRGRFLTERDVNMHLPVCVLGAAAKRELFGFQDPIGKMVKVNKRLFRVIGLMEPKEVGSAKAFSALRDLNSDVYIPITISISDFQIASQQVVPADYSEGTLYPHLHQLEKDGLIEGYWENVSGGRDRKSYRITEKGTHELARRQAELREFQKNVNRVLSVAPEAG